MRIKIQKVKTGGNKYESYRITIPKAIYDIFKLEDKDLELESRGNKLILTPVEKED